MPAVHSRTPDSERSLYFDAPTSIPHNSMATTQEIPAPIPGPVNIYDNDPTPVEHAVVDDSPEQRKSIVQHPNGSEGWLPTEDAAPKPMQHTKPPSEHVAETQQASSVLSPKINEDLPIQTNGEYASGGALLAGTAVAAGATRNQSLGRSSSRRSEFTTIDARTTTGSAFVNGAGATGPMATSEEDSALRARAIEAHDNLSPRQKAKIAREETKNGKRLSKIIRSEAKTEKQSLGIMIKELEDLQKIQQNAVKSEAVVQGNHSKLLTRFKKKEALYLNAKREYETANAELNAEGETLEAVRANARDATARMQDKAAEVDSLRKTLAVDNREREIKLAQLEGRSAPKKGGFWKD
ncbi:hypothetical protein BDN70DRAFT_887351 [Pholiota conissans]|uniref:DNA binding protein Ncp1 n=1 Tax=Pholiota conissans TaxID=109636 RepID=A0A9P5YND4_9AGAR|nr:hypothetical protein BDN70DRAFT_887351 [Pholiota conissans]